MPSSATHPVTDRPGPPALAGVTPSFPVRLRPELHARRVLVTGALGFIGRHLIGHLLDAGADVHALVRPGAPRTGRPIGLPDHPRVRWHECDLADPADVERTLRDSDPEVVFHLASKVAGRRDPGLVLPMMEDNVAAAVNVMTAAHEIGGRRVILAGSVEEPRDRDEAPSSPYAAAKAAATGYARLFHEQWDLPVTVLRIAMVYGPGQPDESKLLPYLITTMLDLRHPSVSSGGRGIDWVHVDDVCRAFLATAMPDAAAGLVADVGSGVATTIADTVEMVAALTGYRGSLGLGAAEDRRGDRARIADLTAAAESLGWHPQVLLDAGLAETVQWYSSRRNAQLARSDGGPGGIGRRSSLIGLAGSQ
jgi:UDP-glucose 4-epimerase